MREGEMTSAIKAAGSRILSVYKRFNPEIMAEVSSVLHAELRRNGPRLYEDDVESIRRRLIVKDKANTRATWLRHDCFNKLVRDLNGSRKFRIKYINIPTRVRRNLAVGPSDELQSTIGLIQILHDGLMEFREPSSEDLKQIEIECVCSFLASAAIFAKILFNDYHLRMLEAKFRDIHLSPDYINIPFKNSDAFYRYFLPFPASAYFLRCVLFYQKNYLKLGVRRPQNPDDCVITPVHFRPKDLASLFRKWTLARLGAHGEGGGKGLSFDALRHSVKNASIADISPEHIWANSYPPFVISVQSGEISSYSYSNDFFPYFLGTSQPKAEYKYPAKATDKSSDPDARKSLRKCLSEIRSIRRKLLSKVDSLPERRAAAQAIIGVSESRKRVLDKDDYDNLSLYVHWLEELLTYKTPDKDKIKAASVDNYAPKIEKFLYELSGEGSLFRLSEEERGIIVKRTMRRYSTEKIKHLLQSFSAFVKRKAGDEFQDLNWKKKEYSKEDAPSLKPLITPVTLKTITGLFHGEFSAWAKRLKKDDALKRRRLAMAEQKAVNLAHMTCLSFYGGLRIDEAASLRLNDVIFDGGIMLRIPESKTNNGKRNIPLSRLAPREYLEQFEEYYKKRADSAYSGALLFTPLNSTKWRPSHASNAVSKVFRKHGYPDFTFHNLRDSFASLFLVRWFVAFHKGKLPAHLPCFGDDLFSEEGLLKLRGLVLGMHEVPRGQELFTYAAAVLARLMGHGGPRITFECYIHTTDWLFYLLSEHYKQETIRLNCKQAESFLQVTYPTLPKAYKKRGLKAISVDEFLTHQRSLIRMPQPITPRSLRMSQKLKKPNHPK